MKKSGISRRDFMKGMATGALSVAIIPSWANKSAANSEETVASLPPFFDCNKYFGPGFPKHPDFPAATNLIAHMDRLGIDRAVAWYTEARDPHPMTGNEHLLDEIKSAGALERIIPSFIISPSMINEPGEMQRLLDLVKNNHIRGNLGHLRRAHAPLPDIGKME